MVPLTPAQLKQQRVHALFSQMHARQRERSFSHILRAEVFRIMGDMPRPPLSEVTQEDQDPSHTSQDGSDPKLDSEIPEASIGSVVQTVGGPGSAA
jgi:hypothetical protein